MPETITAYRVFVASPGDLRDERNSFRSALQEHNDEDAVERGVLFVPMGWEDTPGGRGRPQAIINRDVQRSDFFVLILHEWWGSAPQRGQGYTSGSEEEFSVAREAAKSGPMKEILVFFKDVDPEKLKDPGQQLARVLEFRRKLEEDKEYLFETFDEAETFQRKLRKHCAKWVREHEQSAAGVPKAAPQPAPAPVPPPQPAFEVGGQSGSAVVAGAAQLAREGKGLEAERALAGVITAAPGAQPSDEQFEAMVRYGGLLMQRGSPKSAEGIFQQLRDKAKAEGAWEWEAAALNNLGKVHAAMNDPKQAETDFRDALEIRERRLANGDVRVAESLNLLAEFLGSQFRYAEAAVLLERALQLQGVDVAV